MSINSVESSAVTSSESARAIAAGIRVSDAAKKTAVLLEGAFSLVLRISGVAA